VKRRRARRTDFGARLPNGGEATGWRYPDGTFVVYDEAVTFTAEDWERLDKYIKSRLDLMQYVR
jgi:hypothetical protein